jgi:hypothetical protein
MFPLQVITVGPAGASSVSFTNIPSTYSHLQIRLIGRTDTGSNENYIGLTYNNVTTSNYTEHGLYADGSTVTANSGTGNPFAIVQRIAGGAAAANIFGTAVIDILDYANTNKLKTMRSLGGVDRNGAGVLGFYSSILTTTTNAITSLELKPNAGNFVANSQFALYAVKGA